MVDKKTDNLFMEQRKHLLAAKEEVLRLAPEKAFGRILEEPHPVALVHSFAEEDFYFLVQGVGPANAGPLLAMANDSQWEYIVDLEIWHRDRVQVPSVTKWLNLLMEADPKRLVRWAIKEKAKLFELFMYRNIEVRVREHDQDPSDFGKEFHTLDDVNYFRVLPEPPEAKDEDKSGIDREKTITRFLEHLAENDHVRFQAFLSGSAGIIPAEVEEEMFRLRNVRLSEKGFLPFDDAVGIYQPIQPEDLEKQVQKVLRLEPGLETDLLVPQLSAGLLEEDNLFTRGLGVIPSHAILHQLQAEFTGLCNQLISADQVSVRDRKQLRTTVLKASGYIHIALENLVSEPDTRRAWGRAAQLIERYPLIQLFRVGYGRALALKWRVERWRRESWFEAAGLPLSFWGEEWVGVLGGLFLTKPLFFYTTASGQRYREFRSEEDISHTSGQLDGVIGFDGLFAFIETRIDFKPGQFLTYKKLILTLWARHYLGIDAPGEQTPADPFLSLEEFKRFFHDLFSTPSERDPGRRKHVRESMKTAFLAWASEKSGLGADEISDTLGFFLEAVSQELEHELGPVVSRDLDPRFISLFLVRSEITSEGHDGTE